MRDPRTTSSGRKVLVIDVGGTNVKALASGAREWRRFASGRRLTAERMVAKTKTMVGDWTFDTISIGYPGPVIFGHVIGNPRNLARGWIGFDFGAAFGLPVKVVNDAALPAIGSYEGGSMLFIGLGTGVGSVMIVDGMLETVVLDELPYKVGGGYHDYLATSALHRLGRAVGAPRTRSGQTTQGILRGRGHRCGRWERPAPRTRPERRQAGRPGCRVRWWWPALAGGLVEHRHQDQIEARDASGSLAALWRLALSHLEFTKEIL